MSDHLLQMQRDGVITTAQLSMARTSAAIVRP